MRKLPVRIFERIRIPIYLRNNRVPILVLQPGKVGSSSIFDGLVKNQSQHPVFHVHHINKAAITKVEACYKSAGTYIRHHLVVARILSDLMAQGKLPKAYIVTAVREPISRRISAFFENCNVTHPEFSDLDKTSFIRESMAALHRIFAEECDEIIRYDTDWFQSEIEDVFGLPVLSQQFDRNKNYMLVENERAKMVLFRMEELSEAFEDGLEDLLGRRVALGDRNVAERKHYADAYSSVMRELRIPKYVLQQMVDSRFMQTFYRDRCDELLQKWSA